MASRDILDQTPDPHESASAPFRTNIQRLLDRATAQPARVMLSGPEQQIDGAQFARALRNTAADLLAGGIEAGTVVALVLPTSIEAVVVRYAAGLLGCATVVCPHAHDPRRLALFVGTVHADAVICLPATADVAASIASSTPVTVIDHVDFETSSPESIDQVGAVSPNAVGVMVTSGGTTGDSKASRRTFKGWLDAITGPPCPDRRQLLCTPLAYIAQILLDQTLLGGGTVVLRDGFVPSEVLATIEAERITHLCLVEPWLVQLADDPDVGKRDLSSLVALSHIGADAAGTLRRRLIERLGPCLVHPYGASEFGLVSVLGPDLYIAGAEAALDSSGRALPGVDIRIECPDGTAAAAGESGRIVVRSVGVATDYAGGRDQSAFRKGGWYDTNDCGFFDAEGLLHVRGRIGDECFIGRNSMFPVDIQDELCAHPDVAYAVAIPSEHGPGFDVAVLSLATSTTPPELLSQQLMWLRGLAHVTIIDRMPVTEQGKPDRIELRRIFATLP